MTNHVERFRANQPKYVSFALKLKTLLEEILQQDCIRYNFVESRAKAIESFAEKIARPDKSYTDPIADLPDLVGVRIVVYYSDDIPKCAALIKNEFDVKEEELCHQPERLSADQFGYLSMHIVACLSSSRSRLTEWRSYQGIQFEVQLRTVLQHSWAAISHALQYKRQGDVPHGLRRKLHRLAGIFELADEQFMEIRDLSNEIKAKTAEALAKDGDNVRVDVASLEALIHNWSYLSDCFSQLEEMGIKPEAGDEAGLGFGEEFDRDYLGDVVEHCDRIGIKTILQLKNALDYDPRTYFKCIVDGDWIMDKRFVLYLLLIGAKPEVFSVEILTQTSHWDSGIAKRVIDGARKARKK